MTNNKNINLTNSTAVIIKLNRYFSNGANYAKVMIDTKGAVTEHESTNHLELIDLIKTTRLEDDNAGFAVLDVKYAG